MAGAPTGAGSPSTASMPESGGTPASGGIPTAGGAPTSGGEAIAGGAPAPAKMRYEFNSFLPGHEGASSTSYTGQIARHALIGLIKGQNRRFKRSR